MLLEVRVSRNSSNFTSKNLDASVVSKTCRRFRLMKIPQGKRTESQMNVCKPDDGPPQNTGDVLIYFFCGYLTRKLQCSFSLQAEKSFWIYT